MSMAVSTHPNGIAPVESGNYKLGAKGGRMAQAWQHVWDRLDRTEWKGSLELAREAAEVYQLKPISVSEMLCRMRQSGVIEQKMITADTEYTRKGTTFTSQRRRVHYRIAKNPPKKAEPDPSFVKIAPPSYRTSAGVNVGPTR